MGLIVVFLKFLYCLDSPLVDYKNVHINSFLQLHLLEPSGDNWCSWKVVVGNEGDDHSQN